MRYALPARKVETQEFVSLEYDTAKHVFTLDGDCLLPTKPVLTTPLQGMAIRITLGHRCNFACAYCSQERDADRTDALAPEDLAREVHAYFGDTPIRNLQYWGGEPTVYFEYIQAFHETFAALRAGQATFGTSSNGSLFHDDGLTDWMLANEVAVAFSHDGPGQALRGPDVLRSATVRDNVRRMHEAHLLTLQPTMHRLNPSLRDCVAHILNALDIDAIPVGAAKLLNIYNADQMALAVSAEELPGYALRRYCEHLAGMPVPVDMSQAISRFLSAYGQDTAPGLGCHVMNPLTVVIDTAGNILDCQNFTAADVDEGGDAHKLGAILGTTHDEHHPEPKLTRLRQREDGCKQCAVYRLCRGACAFTASKYLEYNCRAKFYEHLATLGLVLTYMTEGDLILDPCVFA